MQAALPILRDRRFWAGLTGLGLVLGVAGPFGTVTGLPLLPRMAYWLGMVYLTGSLGLICSRGLGAWLRGLGLPRLLAAIPAGALTGLPIAALVLGINALLLRPGDVALGTLPLALSLVGISVAISVAAALAFHRAPPPHAEARPALQADTGPADRPTATGAAPPGLPRLLQRLPDDLRAPLIRLEATDHYTRITTEAGSATILLRFSDAVAESAPIPGLRLHRSHWVARDRIATARRDGPRARVTTRCGSELPVSRAHVPALEAAGLLPPR